MNDFASYASTSLAHLRDDDRLDGIDLTIEQRILDGDEVVACYHVVLGASGVRVVDGPAERADVAIEQDTDTALALRSGALHAQSAFLTGRLTVRGDVQKLVEHGAILSELLGTPRA